MKTYLVEQNRWFQVAVFLLFILTLFFGADHISLFQEEAKNGVSAINGLVKNEFWTLETEVSPLMKLITGGAYSTIAQSEWGLRMPNALMLIFSFFIFYKLGAKIFSEKVAIISLLFAAGSFPLLLIGKLSVADIWLFSLSLIQYLLVIYQLKRPRIAQFISILLLSVLFLFVQPISSFVFHVSLLGILFLLHPKKRHLQGLFLGLLLIHIAYTITCEPVVYTDGFLFSYQKNIGLFLVATLGGMLFSLGFFPVAIWHIIRRLRAKEELAILTFSGLVAGLLSMSLLAHFILLLLVVKQVLAYTQKNYPYQNLAKIGTIIQVVFACLLGIYIIMGSYGWFQGTGFRRAFFFGTPYWAFGIYTLVSMYVFRAKHLIMSIVLGAVVSNFLFWTQIIPLWDTERNVYKEMVVTIQEHVGTSPSYVQIKGEEGSAIPEFYKKTILNTVENETRPSIYVVNKKESSVEDGKVLGTVFGREFPWEEKKTYIILEK